MLWNSTRVRLSQNSLLNATLLTVSVALLLLRSPSSIESGGIKASSETATQALTAMKFESQFVQAEGGPPSVHSGTITELTDGRLMSGWFAGTREGARDVQILMSYQKPGAAGWSPATVIASREQTARELSRHIAKLGNPILFTDSRGRVWLFYVTVSFGGWSGSSVSMRYSDDGGQSWSSARRLVTSPFLNVSTLIKGSPIECETGHILLPVYHEFLRKFSEVLTISPDGELISKNRLTAVHKAIQPCAVPTDEHSARIFYRQNRHAHKRVLTNTSSDLPSEPGGMLVPTNMPNPDSAISVIRWGDGFLMACNPIEVGRHRLSLATSRDGISWQIARDIETGAPPNEFSYPYLMQSSTGEYHLLYTWNRTKIRHIVFNDAWLEARP